MTAAVTGGTGFLGLRLIHQLLERDDRVIALGRRGQRPATDRIAEFLQHSGIAGDERTRLLRGLRVVDIDLEQPRMGLSERVFRKLADAGVRRPLLCHTSTVSVVGSQQRGLVLEQEVAVEPAELNSVYERSKFEAERIVCDWSRRTDRPAVIFRPSGLIARSPQYPGCPLHPLQTAARAGKSLFGVSRW
ncbi:SDR family oxidoreductase [Nocardia fluminea]|uniref:SDR family oxidoreductase n=1 Tax=Nocardia fluminea TaxID=134984 RepID=UPI00342AD506